MDAAMKIYQGLGRNILGLTALSTVFCLAAFTFVIYFALPSLGYTEHADNITAQVGEAILTMFIAIGVGGPLLVLGVSYSSAVIVLLASEYMMGNLPNPASIRDSARRLWPKMFAIVLIEVVAVFGGLILASLFMAASGIIAANTPSTTATAGVVAIFASISLVVGLIAMPFVAGRHALAIPAVVLEGASPLKAIKRSTSLLKGSQYIPSGYGTIITLYFAMFFLLFVLAIGYGVILSLIPGLEPLLLKQAGTTLGPVVVAGVELLPVYLALWTLIPVWCTTTTVLYFERRIRWEGYDIEALAQDVWRTDRGSRFEF